MAGHSDYVCLYFSSPSRAFYKSLKELYGGAEILSDCSPVVFFSDHIRLAPRTVGFLMDSGGYPLYDLEAVVLYFAGGYRFR